MKIDAIQGSLFLLQVTPAQLGYAYTFRLFYPPLGNFDVLLVVSLWKCGISTCTRACCYVCCLLCFIIHKLGCQYVSLVCFCLICLRVCILLVMSFSRNLFIRTYFLFASLFRPCHAMLSVQYFAAIDTIWRKHLFHNCIDLPLH